MDTGSFSSPRFGFFFPTLTVEDKATILALAFQPITKGNAPVKARKGPRMFEVLITYNEFLRHPDVFKDFIKEPKKLTKWNF